jgi:HPt (histidine-containing phosphotransfer) domain-containing protein
MVEFANQLGVEPGADAVELLLSLWESLAALPEELHHALETRSRTELREVAHGGKGAAKALAAFPLGQLCSDLQDESESSGWEALEQLVQRVQSEHARASELVRTLHGGGA